MKEYFKDLKDKKFLISIISLLVGQSILYVVVKHLQSGYNTFNYSIDGKIPLIPSFVIIYNLFYPFLFFVFFYLFKRDKITYDKAIIAGILGYLICNIIFIIYPVQMVRPDITNINTDWLSNLVLHLTYELDQPAINCFPSIHCLFCFQALYSTVRGKNIPLKYRIFVTFMALSIIASIFFVKQHYVIDMIAALIVFITCNVIVESIYNRIKKD